MKRKLDPVEKIRRQEWRNAHLVTPSTAPARQKQVAKSARAEAKVVAVALAKHRESLDPKPAAVSEIREPIAVLADLYKGTSYKGPYVHITHRQAFLTRQSKRLERERVKYADGAPIVTELGEDTTERYDVASNTFKPASY